MKYLVGFCAFWWDFIVGDSIVLLVHGGYPGVAEVALPGIVIATLVGSLYQR